MIPSFVVSHYKSPALVFRVKPSERAVQPKDWELCSSLWGRFSPRILTSWMPSKPGCAEVDVVYIDHVRPVFSSLASQTVLHDPGCHGAASPEVPNCHPLTWNFQGESSLTPPTPRFVIHLLLSTSARPAPRSLCHRLDSHFSFFGAIFGSLGNLALRVAFPSKSSLHLNARTRWRQLDGNAKRGSWRFVWGDIEILSFFQHQHNYTVQPFHTPR